MNQRCARVAVALSGGVDSAVAAALLVEQGHEVIGATLQLWGACSLQDEQVARARRVAGVVGVPFQLIDAHTEFGTQVVDYLVAEYGAGRTPNPCVPCNRAIKFGLLLDWALGWGAGFLATGHYARVRCGEGRYELLRGCDRSRDQSYFLYTLSQGQLAHVSFPLGGLTKEEVRAIARRKGLPVANRPASQDLCLFTDGDYRQFLAERAPHLFTRGPIRDTSGRVLGQHKGLPTYTVGQRKGLGIAWAEPLYVLAIDPAENALVVGTAQELDQVACVVEQMHYVSGEVPDTPFQAGAQIRYRALPAEVTVAPLPHGRAEVQFALSQRGVTPGQSLVLYEGDVVLGGGIICKAYPSVI